MLLRIQAFFNKHTTSIVLAIIALASFLRLYRISDYMNFLGDEGRDVLTVKHILEGQLTFLGPRSSAADFYYGPIYYYLITPFLWLFHYDPVGPAVFIAILGILTVFLVYKVGKKFFGTSAGIVAAALYAVSPVVITYSHSSWNPNPLPLVSLVTLFLSYSGLKSPKLWKFLVIGILLGIAIQLQYLALFLGMIIFAYVGMGTVILDKKSALPHLFKRFLFIAVGFIVGWSPFLAFEVHHGFPNLKTIVLFLSGKIPSSVLTNSTPLGQVYEVFLKLFARLVTVFPLTDLSHIHDTQQLYIWYLLSLLLGIVSVVGIIRIKDKLAQLLIILWLVIGIGMFAFYKKSIYDYYLGFMFPLPFLLIGNLATELFNVTKQNIVRLSVITVVLFLFIFNIFYMPFRFEPNKIKDQVKTISEIVISHTDNKPFNFALITNGNSDHAYRYYLEVLGHKPVEMQNPALDPKRKTVTDQLMVVCEDLTCGPLGYSLFEVAGFGRAEIAGVWDGPHVKVFRLVHYRGK
jgi:4-amino-4-deoxy-L-arabinose transferase-like glycosyltransferase